MYFIYFLAVITCRHTSLSHTLYFIYFLTAMPLLSFTTVYFWTLFTFTHFIKLWSYTCLRLHSHTVKFTATHTCIFIHLHVLQFANSLAHTLSFLKFQFTITVMAILVDFPLYFTLHSHTLVYFRIYVIHFHTIQFTFPSCSLLA